MELSGRSARFLGSTFAAVGCLDLLKQGYFQAHVFELYLFLGSNNVRCGSRHSNYGSRARGSMCRK